MGVIFFDRKTLGDSVSETVGYKSGLGLSIEAMCDHLSDTHYADILAISETKFVRICVEEYESLFYKLLHRIGYTEEEFDGDITGIGSYHKYKGTDLEKVHLGVLDIFNQTWPQIIEEATANGAKALNPELFMRASAKEYGRQGIDMAYERLMTLDKGLNLSPHSALRYTQWDNIETLESLFKGGSDEPQVGTFIDQRFINYLYANHDKLGEMHWRKFEELTAEFFERHGYKVELGPGSNDDGVDVRVWKSAQDEENDAPHIIIQCKRQKKKVQKVVVKGLYADMLFQKAGYGLVVTSSELSPGSKKTIIARGYDIDEIDNKGLRVWLKTLQMPGTGIVRI